jgi:hypothetical protein
LLAPVDEQTVMLALPASYGTEQRIDIEAWYGPHGLETPSCAIADATRRGALRGQVVTWQANALARMVATPLKEGALGWTTAEAGAAGDYVWLWRRSALEPGADHTWSVYAPAGVEGEVGFPALPEDMVELALPPIAQALRGGAVNGDRLDVVGYDAFLDASHVLTADRDLVTCQWPCGE